MGLERQGRPLAGFLFACALLAGCGSSGAGDAKRADGGTSSTPALGGHKPEPQVPDRPASQPAPATADSAFPASATKNTTRVGGADAVTAAAAIARAVFPSRSAETRPSAVALVDAGDWRTAISAAQLMSRPIRAPVLFTRGDAIPPATSAALQALRPTGAGKPPGAQVIELGPASAPPAFKRRTLGGGDFAARARAIDHLRTAAAGKPTPEVLVASADHPDVAMPAAGWAAKAGTPVLWVTGSEIPPATRAAIRDHGRPRIFLLGPPSAISAALARRLARLGAVRRIAGGDAIATAVAFARYARAGFGWNAVDPGHGFVFARASEPLQAAAAAPLSASGSYGPLLLLSDPRKLDKPVEDYLLDVQPGYDSDPVRGVYNHGWLVGDVASISVDVQARIDALLEIQPVDPAP